MASSAAMRLLGVDMSVGITGAIRHPDLMMNDDDPLFRLMERMWRLGEQLPSEEEVLHDENARHRAMMLVAEMRKIDKEVREMGKRERERQAGRAAS